MNAPSESTRRTLEAIAFCMDAPDLTLEKLDALIEWATTGKQPADGQAHRGDLLHALFKLRLQMAIS